MNCVSGVGGSRLAEQPDAGGDSEVPLRSSAVVLGAAPSHPARQATQKHHLRLELRGEWRWAEGWPLKGDLARVAGVSAAVPGIIAGSLTVAFSISARQLIGKRAAKPDSAVSTQQQPPEINNFTLMASIFLCKWL